MSSFHIIQPYKHEWPGVRWPTSGVLCLNDQAGLLYDKVDSLWLIIEAQPLLVKKFEDETIFYSGVVTFTTKDVDEIVDKIVEYNLAEELLNER